MKSRLRKNPFIRTAEEYASQSSIHGIGYIFNRKLGLVDRLIWMVVVLAFLSLASYLTQNMWTQWQGEQVVTTLKNTAKPVTEVPFPAVTICGSGIHMSNVENKIQKDFVEWRDENEKNETGREAIRKDVEEYMRETFQIDQKSYGADERDPVSILDIIDTMVAPDVDASVAANGIRSNILACKEANLEKETGGNSENEEAGSCCPRLGSGSASKLVGNKCFVASSDKEFLNRTNAKMRCKELGGTLAIINDAAEDEVVIGLIGEMVWLGLYRDGENSPFKWQDGSNPSFTNWDDGEPKSNTQRCVARRSWRWKNRKWFVEPCSEERNYVCSTTSACAPAEALGEMLHQQTCIPSEVPARAVSLLKKFLYQALTCSSIPIKRRTRKRLSKRKRRWPSTISTPLTCAPSTRTFSGSFGNQHFPASPCCALVNLVDRRSIARKSSAEFQLTWGCAVLLMLKIHSENPHTRHWSKRCKAM